ncbi:ATP-dependent DNA helicase 2 subunit KU70 [Micractinium conductrix]|uniref:ATP-dependent DNA helicase 2 subunit KU70 n=1 Tax=Micractinium conductrix TaxID=554055 RepID=A0A2P6UZ31_9CHLO|nr:ATP-dependent DNA helicase 2 subunit KU70 [Micractinium conductrix]|eukprot:PSC67098.1 ATP-dependent DNA helicase 2 subunit KU70 [Micractinium conductrix]
MLRRKVINCTKDQAAVVLYNTRECDAATEDSCQYPHSCRLLGMGPPSADGIATLEGFNVDTFEKRYGSSDGSDGKAAVALKSALWQAVDMTEARKAGKTRVLRRLMVFTRDAEPMRRYSRGVDPSPEWKRIEGHLATLRQASAVLELYPMLGPNDDKFDLTPFWRPLLLQLRGASSADVDEAVGEQEQLGYVGDLMRFVRTKARQRRAVASLVWQLAPPGGGGGGLEGGLGVGVRLYNMLQEQKKPAKKWVHGLNNAQVEPQTAMFDISTGAQVGAGELRQFYPHGKDMSGSRLRAAAAAAAAGAGAAGAPPPKIYFNREELQRMRGTGQPGMVLLGFKPLRRAQGAGSATTLIALHEAMVQSGRFAVCRLAATRARMPSLVAVVPQQELLDGYGGQMVPPGFNLITLPFSDDLRQPERNQEFTGAHRAAPGDEGVAAAEELVAAMQMPDFFPGELRNPVLQRYYEVLEAKALYEEPPPVEEAQDDTQPWWSEGEALPGGEESGDSRTYSDIISKFKEATRLGDDEAAKAPKRKAVAPALADTLAALDVEGRAARGELPTLRVDDLKAWLRSQGKPISGNKAELVARINNALGL